MFSRVFRNRLPKTVQIRKFCQPEKPKIEQLYKKFQNDPELKDLLKDVFKNESIVVGNKTTDMSRLFDMLENKSIVVDKNKGRITEISLEQKITKNTEIQKGPVEEAIVKFVMFYAIGFGIMFVLVSIAYVFIFAKVLLTDEDTTILTILCVPFYIIVCGCIACCYASVWPISIPHIMKYGL